MSSKKCHAYVLPKGIFSGQCIRKNYLGDILGYESKSIACRCSDDISKHRFRESDSNYLYSYNVKDIKEGYICDCSEVYTLPPSGIIQKGCPNFYNFNIIEECLSCPLAGICKPCPLQRNCAFPKELYKLISGDKCYGCSY